MAERCEELWQGGGCRSRLPNGDGRVSGHHEVGEVVFCRAPVMGEKSMYGSGRRWGSCPQTSCGVLWCPQRRVVSGEDGKTPFEGRCRADQHGFEAGPWRSLEARRLKDTGH